MIENRSEEILTILSKLRKNKVKKLIDLQSWNQHDNILSHFDEQSNVYGIYENSIYPLEINVTSEKIYFLNVPNHEKIEFDHMKHSIRFYQNLLIINEEGKIFKYNYPVNINGTLKDFFSDFSDSFNSSSFKITKIFYDNKELNQNDYFHSFVKKPNEASLILMIENRKEIFTSKLRVDVNHEVLNKDPLEVSFYELYFSSNRSFIFQGFSLNLSEKSNPACLDVYMFENSFDTLVYSKEDFNMDLCFQNNLNFDKVMKIKKGFIYLLQIDFKTSKEKIKTNLIESSKDENLKNLDIFIKFHKRFMVIGENISDNIVYQLSSPIEEIMITPIPYFN